VRYATTVRDLRLGARFLLGGTLAMAQSGHVMLGSGEMQLGDAPVHDAFEVSCRLIAQEDPRGTRQLDDGRIDLLRS
jgi:hypothetical protein